MITATLAVAFGLLAWGFQLTVRLNRLEMRQDETLDHLTETLRDRQEAALDLIRLCSGYMETEECLIEAVALSRCHAMQARTILARTKTETDLSWALARLLQATESHAQLANHPRFKEGMAALNQAENKVAFRTLAYNAKVADVDHAMVWPLARMVAQLTGVIPGEPFELDPKVARESMMMQLSTRDSRTGSNTPVPMTSVAFSV